mgnify:CR=1 FL=1
MGRRFFLRLLYQREHIDLSEIANAFASEYGKWANAMNTSKPGTLDLKSHEHWQSTLSKWKILERSMLSYYRGW